MISDTLARLALRNGVSVDDIEVGSDKDRLEALEIESASAIVSAEYAAALAEIMMEV